MTKKNFNFQQQQEGHNEGTVGSNVSDVHVLVLHIAFNSMYN
jgi:hypothetical protein